MNAHAKPHRDNPRPAAPITKAGDWFAARQAGKRLPEHLFPEELETALATQRMEKIP